jgi:AcrR family transcriptional regulator
MKIADLARKDMSPRMNEILDTAARIFHEKGYAPTTVQDIADAVGMLKGSLYHYIDTKEDLLFVILRDVDAASQQRLEEYTAAEGDALAKIRLLIETHLVENTKRLHKMGVFLHDFRSLSEERRAVVEQGTGNYANFLRKLIAEGQSDGSIDPELDPRLVSMAIIGMVNWVYKWYSPDGPDSPEKIASQFIDFALGGLAGNPASDRRVTKKQLAEA